MPAEGSLVSDAGIKLTKDNVTPDGAARVALDLKSNSGSLPEGDWVLRVYADGKFIRTMGFVITSALGGAAPTGSTGPAASSGATGPTGPVAPTGVTRSDGRDRPNWPRRSHGRDWSDGRDWPNWPNGRGANRHGGCTDLHRPARR